MQTLASLGRMLAASASTAIALTAIAGAQSSRGPAGNAPERLDYLTFAQGAIPIAIEGPGARLGASFEQAVRITDGDPTSFTIVTGARPETETVFVYELPAATTFDRFAVPNVQETPSPTQTFTRIVEVHGSASSPTEGYALLASGTLATHRARGQVTELKIAAKRPVRWIRLRLVGGIDTPEPLTSFEFSEIIGNGTQDTAPMMDTFHGVWRTGSNVLDLQQRGPVVSGCYDRTGHLTGTVTGNILRATGLDRWPSAFILTVMRDGSVRGVRSTNKAPFRLYSAAAAAKGATGRCGKPAPPMLGCGSVIHGINFDFDSARIRPESQGVLAELFVGLKSDARRKIVIEGHTSSEGATAYNQQLSERRARAVVTDLVGRGLVAERVSAAGLGEVRPIAANTDESGRLLNRRVEVKCQ